MTDDSTYRQRTLRTSILVAVTLQHLGGWHTARDVAAAYRADVGRVHWRTVYRYLVTLAECGMVESRGTRPLEWRWLGWPKY